jgi:hypothetical protein
MMLNTDQKFSVMDVLTVSVSIQEKNGYVKNHLCPAGKQSNVDMLRNHFYGDASDKITVTQQHEIQAQEVAAFFRCLSFKALERDLSAYESNALRFVTQTLVDYRAMGIAASLPSTYLNKSQRDEWQHLEAELAVTSKPVGEIHKIVTLDNLKVHYVQQIGRDQSKLVCCADDQGNIVKFFSNRQDFSPVKPGDTLNVQGFVKSQGASKFHGGQETMLNNIRLVKKSPVSV